MKSSITVFLLSVISETEFVVSPAHLCNAPSEQRESAELNSTHKELLPTVYKYYKAKHNLNFAVHPGKLGSLVKTSLLDSVGTWSQLQEQNDRKLEGL